MDASSEPAGTAPPSGLDQVIAAGREARLADRRRRSRASFGVSAAVGVVWLIVVTATDRWGRVADHGVAALTMVFGSFVAGATPQGGGAVAFPVFTKALEIPSETARSFSLCIQTVGMGAASISILVRRSPVEWRAVAVGAGAGSVAFGATLGLAADWSEPFAPLSVPGPYVKVTFSLIVLAMTVATVVGLRSPIRTVTDRLPAAGPGTWALLVAFSLAGGVAAALLGSGADVMIYLFLVVILGVRSTVGVPTSVLTMTAISAVGFVTMAVVDRQFVTGFTPDGLVASIGGEALAEPVPVRQADLFGMWLAAAPIVAWGAPLGALVASRLRSVDLARVVVALGVIEVGTTIAFVPELRSDAALAAYGAVGAVVGVAAVIGLAARLRRSTASGSLAATTLTRDTVEISADYSEEIHGDHR